jgi:hypothetical protein
MTCAPEPADTSTGMKTPQFLGTFAFLLCACDVGSLAAIGSQKDAKAGFDALLAALGGADSARAGQLRFPRDFRDGEALGDGVHLLADVVVPCTDGGEMVLSGTLEISGIDAWSDIDPSEVDPADFDPSALPSAKFDYSVALDACSEAGVTIDGSITWSMSSIVDADTYGASFDWSYVGTVEFTGVANGECALDLHGLGDGELEGWEDVDPTQFDGDVCGFDAAEALGE